MLRLSYVTPLTLDLRAAYIQFDLTSHSELIPGVKKILTESKHK